MIIAVVGPSGVGKSTFSRSVRQAYSSTEIQCFISGESLPNECTRRARFKALSCYPELIMVALKSRRQSKRVGGSWKNQLSLVSMWAFVLNASRETQHVLVDQGIFVIPSPIAGRAFKAAKYGVTFVCPVAERPPGRNVGRCERGQAECLFCLEFGRLPPFDHGRLTFTPELLVSWGIQGDSIFSTIIGSDAWWVVPSPPV